MSTNGTPELRPLLSPTPSEESNWNKSWTLVVVGFAGLISSCSFWTYYVQWHDMLLLLGIPDTIESLSSDLLRFCAATLGILFASVYSATHGKTRVLAGSLLTQGVGSVLVVSAQSIQWLLLGQTVRYFGIAPVWSNSIGIVGEHFSNGERGKPLGSYVLVTMTGAAFAPFLCLLIRNKVSPLLSIPSYDAWRLTEGILGALSLVCWLLVRRLPPSQVVAFSPRPSSASYGSSPVTLTTSPTNGHSRRNPNHGNGYQSTSSVENRVDVAISLSQARSMSPFSPLSLLKLQNVTPLSFASGSLMYSAIALVWMEVSQFGWNVHLATASDKMAFRRFLPLGMLGMGTGALISGILIDRLTSTRSQNRVLPERRLLLASLGALLLPIGLLIVGFTLKFALDMDPYKGYDSMNEEMNEMGKVDVSLLMVGVFLSGFGAYSPVVPCIEYFLSLVPEEKNVQIIAASDALQLLVTLPLLMVYMIFAQGLGTAVANVIAAVVALYSLGSLWRVSARSNGQPAHESGLRDE